MVVYAEFRRIRSSASSAEECLAPKSTFNKLKRPGNSAIGRCFDAFGSGTSAVLRKSLSTSEGGRGRVQLSAFSALVSTNFVARVLHDTATEIVSGEGFTPGDCR